VFLNEKLRSMQWVAIGLAAAGVIYLTVQYGRLPWIALVLAFSFGFYGLFKKMAPLGALHGMTLEMAVLFVPALGYLIWVETQGIGAFGHVSLGQNLLIVMAGVVTVAPILLFGSAARMIPLSIVGVLQYIAPTLQFLIGVLIYNEPFTHVQLIGFSIIWLALILYWLEGVLHRRKASSSAAVL
jgi:chloramphenicol-sensitive protein RarD